MQTIFTQIISATFALVFLSTIDEIRGAILDTAQHRSESRSSNLFRAFVLTPKTLEKADPQR